MRNFHHSQAWALMIIGAWLMLSPFFVPGYVEGSMAAANTKLAGVVALLLGIGSFIHARDIDRWIDMALGIGSDRRKD